MSDGFDQLLSCELALSNGLREILAQAGIDLCVYDPSKQVAITISREDAREINIPAPLSLDAHEAVVDAATPIWWTKSAGPDQRRVVLVGRSCPAAQLPVLAAMLAMTFTSEAECRDIQSQLDSLSNQLADTYEELTLIYQLSSGMKINRNPEEFILQACMDVLEVMQVRSMGVVLCDPQGIAQTPTLYGEVDIPPHILQRLGGHVVRAMKRASKPLIINSLVNHAEYGYLAPHAAQMLVVPLARHETLMGSLVCFDKLGEGFNTQDIKLLNSIANETAVFLENASLFADARGLMMGLLHSLTSAVDAKDAYTCGHSQRVALYGREIARQANLPETLCDRVYMAGLLHDVGKIGVPEQVLCKPGKLTDEEFDLMKKHVEIGAKILQNVKQVEDLIPGVLYHHERYDGKGYPHRLAGQSIPLLGRILCVADCFDAMTSNRTYRRALPIEVAMMEIRRCAGTQFDPQMADAFLSIPVETLTALAGVVAESTVELKLAA
jgi:putative nucleotidyltransferase with HDIG domain